MNRFSFLKRIPLLQALVLLVSSVAFAYAEANGGFDMSWHTVDGGGGTFSTGGPYTWGGTIGQPDAGASSGGTYAMAHGFWAVPASTPTPSPTHTHTPTPTPVPMLVGHVTWQGRPAQPNALQQLPITFTIKSATTEVNYPVQTTDASGFFTVTVGGLPAGGYVWRAKGSKHLANIGSAFLSGSAVTPLELGLMRAGDTNNDNIVNTTDFTILRNTLGKQCGDPGYDDRADFTGDCLVNTTDFSLLRLNFGQSGGPPIRILNSKF